MTAPSAPTPNDASDPARWLDLHGDALYRFAYLRTRDESLAEDLVQETLLAALKARERFAGESSERTWLIAILKNKLVDHIRRVGREAPLPDDADGSDALDALFDDRDHWSVRPLNWGRPHETLENQQFWRVLMDCLATLPARLAEGFVLREIDGLTADEVCKVLEVSTSNLWVSLHRARMRLRLCLETQWFSHEPE